jgi:hypothetical protein
MGSLFGALGHGQSVSRILRVAIAALSFAVYAIAVLMLDQGRSMSFALEEGGPIPVTLSQRLYQTRSGQMDTGLYRFFLEALSAHLTAEQAIDEALNGRAKPTGISVVVQDGIGIGGIVITEAAFALFGPRAQALPLFFLALVGISAAAFVTRYRDQRMSAVPILFLDFVEPVIYMVSTSLGGNILAQYDRLGGSHESSGFGRCVA